MIIENTIVKNQNCLKYKLYSMGKHFLEIFTNPTVPTWSPSLGGARNGFEFLKRFDFERGLQPGPSRPHVRFLSSSSGCRL